MCLSVVYRGKQKKEALAKLPESGYYWKCVETYGKGYFAPWHSMQYKSGWNTTRKLHRATGYPIAFHLFRLKKDAEQYIGMPLLYHEKIICCKVNKKDIVAIGEQNYGLCIVTTRFWCPKPK